MSAATKKLAILCAALVLGVVSYWLTTRQPRSAAPAIPAVFAASVPPDCRQVVLVLSPNQPSSVAQMWLLEREGRRQPWQVVAGPIQATLGHKGLAWGVGEHTAAAPVGFPVKREGDKCSPAGVFSIPFAFGQAAAEDATWMRLPYKPLTPSIVGVDDPGSAFYNQVVDNSVVERDWDSNEPMQRHGDLYRWGAFIGHNPNGVPGLGSCIFFHLWPGPGKATAGCTATSGADMERMLRWLDAEKNPRLVQGLEGW
jgi:L,D-peptidoglycan transpeptidase YkuD (ErfK/YbiS/YcfS/YnhG family)